ncbi:MAG: preprotein translocase subunit SecG [Paracoccaceae bacterium]
MESVVLIVHLIIALCLIAVVLLQRSEGGALGIGGGGGGLVSARGAGNALTRLTWGLAVAFICTSILLTILSGRGEVEGSVVDDFSRPLEEGQTVPLPGGEGGDFGGGLEGDLLPPAGDEAPVAPPAAD